MLDDEDEPLLVNSPLSTRIENENTFVDIEIYRLEDQNFWTLEVVDELGGSTIWEDELPSDEAALGSHPVRCWLSSLIPVSNTAASRCAHKRYRDWGTGTGFGHVFGLSRGPAPIAWSAR
jgi:hypothetical protein